MDSALHERSLRAIHDDPEAVGWSDEVRDHVRGCAVCEKTQRALTMLRERLRARAQKESPSPALMAGIRRRIEEETRSAAGSAARPRRVVAPRTRSTLAAVAAALLVGVALGWIVAGGLDEVRTTPLGTTRVGDEVARTVADYLEDVNHDRYLLDRMGRPLELVTDSAEEASAWLGHGLGFDLSLGDTPADYELRGARIWHTVSRLSALAVYEDGEASVSVFAVPRIGIDFEALAPIEHDGRRYWTATSWDHRGVAWVDGDLAWSAVSTLDRQALLEWVEEYRTP